MFMPSDAYVTVSIIHDFTVNDMKQHSIALQVHFSYCYG